MLEVDNANCVLVEFVNENNKLAVGYRIWFVDKDFIKNNDNLDTVIKNEITTQILWPNCDVKSASAMKKMIKNLKDDDWTKHAVKVHSYGGWILMHDTMSNIEKFDIAMPSKADRKLLMQRNKSNNKENIKKLSPKNSNKDKRTTHDVINARINASKERAKSIIKETQQADKKRTHFDWSKYIDDTSSDSENYEPMAKKTKSVLEDKIQTLQIENKELKNKLKLYEDIDNISEKTATILANLNKLENVGNCKIINHKKSKTPIASNRNITENREQRQNNTLKFDDIEDNIAESFLKLYEHPVNNTETILTNVNKLDNTIDKIPIANQIANNRNTAAEMLNDDKEDRMEPLHFEDIKEDTEESLLDISEDTVKNNTGKHKETDTNNARDFNMVSLGSSIIKIDAKILSNINKTKVGLMTCGLLDALFEGQELSNFSRTGKKTNKGDGKKSIQNDARYIAIRDYVLQYFGKTMSNVDDISKKAVTDKCKNASRNFKQKEHK